MNNEPQASQETLGDTSQGGSVDSNAQIKKHAKKILLIIITLLVIVATEAIGKIIQAQEKISIAVNLQSVISPPPLSNKTNNV